MSETHPTPQSALAAVPDDSNLRVTAAGVTPEVASSFAAPAPTATPGPPCDPSHSTLYCVYAVQSGDSLSSIATRFNLRGTGDVPSWQVLVHSNKPEIASENELLQVGQKLRIPTSNAVVHTVLSSETLTDIADQYDVPTAAIQGMSANGIANANALRIGQEILVPDPNRLAKPVPPVPVAPPAAAAAPTSPPSDSASTAGASRAAGTGPVSRSGFMWPASGPISSPFGSSHPLGIDIDLFAAPNAPNLAAAAGTVTFAGGNPCCSYGYYVVIDHGNGYQSLYAHFSKLSVSVGQKVSQGQVLGLAGRTGYATGNHLHFELRLNGTIVNPMSYLP